MKNILFISLCVIYAHANGQNTTTFNSEEQTVLDVVNLFFKSMTEKDTAIVRQIMTLDGQFYATQQKDDGNDISVHTHQRYFERLAGRPERVQVRT